MKESNMRPFRLPLAALVLATSLQARAQDADLKFLQDLAETRNFSLGRPESVKVTPDGSTVLFLRGQPRSPEMRLFALEVASGKVRELITPEQLLSGGKEQISAEEKSRRERMRISTRGFTSYSLSHDGKFAMVSLSGKAYLVPLAGGAPQQIAGPSKKNEPIFDPQLSPDAKSVAFVRGGELWVAPTAGGGAERALTSGATALKTHAQAEFVAQEELDRFTGLFWSPDSKWLVYEEADLSGVEKMYFGDPAHPENPVEATPYPRPGKANARIGFELIAAGGGKPIPIEFDRAKFEYVSEVSWQEGGPLTLLLLSRDQRDLSLVAVDPRSGRTSQLLAEHDDAWLNASARERAYHWLKNGAQYLWSSERGGAWQLELHGPGAVKILTPADWGFGELLAVTPDGKSALVTRKPEPVESQIWSIPFAGGEPVALTQGPDLHRATYARESFAHVLFTQPAAQAQAAPDRIEVIRADGSSAGELPSIAEKPPFSVKLEVKKRGPGLGFWTAIIRPHDFNPAKKYPVIDRVYGGPHVNRVQADPRFYIADQFIADHGYLVVWADGRGTPGRGRAWERAIQDKFATVPLDDQVAALQAMAAQEPAMDLSRVGVMGHSFGGFLAALSVERRSDVYKAAVSSAPVVDWLDYDTAYTERYLGVPPPAGQSEVYAANGLIAYAKTLERPILIIHGTADDNVHFEESLLLSDALFRAGKPFELLPQVGQTHMFYQPELQTRYWQRVFAFFKANL